MNRSSEFRVESEARALGTQNSELALNLARRNVTGRLAGAEQASLIPHRRDQIGLLAHRAHPYPEFAERRRRMAYLVPFPPFLMIGCSFVMMSSSSRDARRGSVGSRSSAGDQATVRAAGSRWRMELA